MKKSVLFARICGSNMTKSEKAVLKHVIGLLDIGSVNVYAGVAGIAARLHITERTVQRAFREFERRGIFTIIANERGGSQPRTYRFDPRGDIEGRQMSPLSLRVTNVTPQTGDKCHRISNTPKRPSEVRVATAGVETHEKPPYQGMSSSEVSLLNAEMRVRPSNLFLVGNGGGRS